MLLVSALFSYELPSKTFLGGQGFVIKLRETSEKSPSSMLLEPPYQINMSFPNLNLPPRWRHIKYVELSSSKKILC